MPLYPQHSISADLQRSTSGIPVNRRPHRESAPAPNSPPLRCTFIRKDLAVRYCGVRRRVCLPRCGGVQIWVDVDGWDSGGASSSEASSTRVCLTTAISCQPLSPPPSSLPRESRLLFPGGGGRMSAGPERENDDADAQITDSCSGSSPPHPFSSLLVPACFPGTFKSKLGDGSCGPCPANSHSSARGASICPCQSSFHRADSDPPESVCTSKSSSGRKRQRSLRA